MKITTKGINIEIEQDEILDLWNIIMFAKDYHSSEAKKGNVAMKVSELQLADSLLKVLDEVK